MGRTNLPGDREVRNRHKNSSKYKYLDTKIEVVLAIFILYLSVVVFD
ncbi:MAG: hypothetical protein BMS9Abin02_2051 [Anaerolineae bacterium]|nr:MAG: hypothetical protein BMS9Abin02_2051 [Anaerolineae bacterium]